MGVKFCSVCNNLLSAVFTNDKLTFNCDICHISYPSSPSDSLRKERIKESDIMIHKVNLNKAVDDPATMKAYVKCLDKKCKGDIVKQVRIGSDMRLYNICMTCKSQFLYN